MKCLKLQFYNEIHTLHSSTNILPTRSLPSYPTRETKVQIGMALSTYSTPGLNYKW